MVVSSTAVWMYMEITSQTKKDIYEDRKTKRLWNWAGGFTFIAKYYKFHVYLGLITDSLLYSTDYSTTISTTEADKSKGKHIHTFHPRRFLLWWPNWNACIKKHKEKKQLVISLTSRGKYWLHEHFN